MCCAPLLNRFVDPYIVVLSLVRVRVWGTWPTYCLIIATLNILPIKNLTRCFRSSCFLWYLFARRKVFFCVFLFSGFSPYQQFKEQTCVLGRTNVCSWGEQTCVLAENRLVLSGASRGLSAATPWDLTTKQVRLSWFLLSVTPIMVKSKGTHS